MSTKNLFFYFFCFFLFFSCKKDEPTEVLIIPKEIHIKKIFASNIPENAPNGKPWDEGSTADIFVDLGMGQFSGGTILIVFSDIVSNIDHSERIEIPLDSTAIIQDPENTFLWSLYNWDEDNFLEPKKELISSSTFKFPFESKPIDEPFIFKSWDGLGKSIFIELELEYIY